MGKLSKDITVIGVNAGLGVALYPFKNNLLFNIESRGIFHTPKNEQWQSNFANIPLYKQLYLNKTQYSKVDVLISSPDCGSGSIFRLSRAKEYGNHKENHSLLMFFEAIDFYKPKIFLFENLEGLFKSFPEKDFDELLKNYRLIKHKTSVAYFGNSQKTRKRLVIVGVRRDLPKKTLKYFRLPDKRDKIKACWELDIFLGVPENPTLCHVREDRDTEISIHAGKKMRLSEIQGIWQTILKGKKRWHLYYPGFKFSTAPGVYRNLKNDYPATARKANRQFDFNGLTMSPRQLARIMGVPDKFNLYFDTARPGYWINKGRTCVTKGMVYEVATWFKKSLIKSEHIWNNQKQS